ncbi:hypothetical protein L226DRAFT_562633 [Lentinus tigrinus ALCF2SS1-7]|uniref:DUF6534 domain-containing protein n=1 Tax=Lentinus tigrinus ALCF2SS1-6 TaxID=1328759 RepID=A0A5C2S6V3_9APHY|nr:hypothetical protein L227DRAFT_612003 [Lentinus tigrinus ALCF2SS1-6]RPD70781.1 hypothetical protein L226DRAFT_562633 [Lentinus tigrinus ALCF2SS1-7]
MSRPALSAARSIAAATLQSTNASNTETVFNHAPPPVLVGGLVALFLSGVVFMQVVLFFQMYQNDRLQTKAIVLAVWLLDITHSAFVCTANWENLIADYGAYSTLDEIQWSIALTIALTALTTVIVHCFFIHRIWKLSRHNWYITVPLILLALLRVASALVTTIEMLRLRSYPLFIAQFSYIFTLGLATSALVDILVTSILCYYIRKGRAGFARINHMIDVLTLYTVENGMLTCIATALSLFFWLFMRHNFAFLGMHLAINKLYANSLLASLNARKSLVSRMQGSGDGARYPLPVMLANPPLSPRNFSHHDLSTNKQPLQVTIDVERTVQHDTVIELGSMPVSEVDLGNPRDSGSGSLTDVKRGR